MGDEFVDVQDLLLSHKPQISFSLRTSRAKWTHLIPFHDVTTASTASDRKMPLRLLAAEQKQQDKKFLHFTIRSNLISNTTDMKLSLSVLVLSLALSNGFTATTSDRGIRRDERSSSRRFASVMEEAPSMNRPATKIPVFDEVCETTGVTLTRFMNEVAILNPEISEITTLFGAIDTACKAISNLVKRSQLPSSETLGYQGEVNVQGEDQKKLDVITNDLLKRALRFTGRLGVLASEEEDEPVGQC